MALVALKYGLATAEQVARYPVHVKQVARPEEIEGSEMDPRLGATGSLKCKLCNCTKFSGCNGHFGRMEVTRMVLPVPTFTSSIVKMYNRLICPRCMRLRNLPEISAVLQDNTESETSREKRILAILAKGSGKCRNCPMLDKYPLIARLGEAPLPEAVNEALLKTAEGVACKRCKQVVLSAMNDLPMDNEVLLREALKNTTGKCNNCNEQPPVLEYKDFVFVVKEPTSRSKNRKGVEERVKDAGAIMEEILAVPPEVWRPARYSEDIGRGSFLVNAIPIPPLIIREPVPEEHSKNKFSVKVANIIDAASRYNENDRETARQVQRQLDSLYNGQTDANPFQRDGPDKNLAQESDGPFKQSLVKSGIFSFRQDKSCRSVAAGSQIAVVGECVPTSKVFEEITVSKYVNRFTIDEVQAMIRRGEVMAYVRYHPDNPVNNYSLQLNPQSTLAQNLTPGSFVERRFREGDVVMVSRNPTLHKHNLMAVRALEPEHQRAVTAVPGPMTTIMGLDFDGDDLNLIVPTGAAAPVEIVLMNAAYNLKNDTTGAPVYGINQEQIVAMCRLYQVRDIPRDKVVRILGKLVDRIRDWSKPTYSGDEVISLLLPPTFDLGEVLQCDSLTLKHFASQSYPSIANYVANVYGTYEGVETINRIYYFVQNLLKVHPIGATVSDLYFDFGYFAAMEKYVSSCLVKFNELIARYYSDVNMKRIPHSEKRFTNIVTENFAKIEEKVTALITAKVRSLPAHNTLLQMLLAQYKVTSKMLKESYCCEGLLTQQQKDGPPTIIPTMLNGKASPYWGWDSMTASSLGFIKSNYIGGYCLADMMMVLTYKVIPHVITQKTNTSICGSHARKVYTSMEPAVSDNLGRLTYNGTVLSQAVNGLKMMGKDICMVPLRAPEADMVWHSDLHERWEALMPFMRYEHNTKKMEHVAFYIDINNYIKTFRPSRPAGNLTNDECRARIIEMVASLSLILYMGAEPTSGVRPSMAQEYVMMYYLDPSRTKGKLGSELLYCIYKKIRCVMITSLSPGTEVGNRQAGNATERHTQESLSAFRSFSRVGKDIPRADFNRFKGLTEMPLRKVPYKIKCYAESKELLEPLKHIYRFTSLGNMNPTISVVNNGSTIRIEIYRANMEIESITPVDLWKMLDNYFARRNDLKYTIAMSFPSAEVLVTDVVVKMASSYEYGFTVEDIACFLESVVTKGKSRKTMIDILEITMYNARLEETQGYSISFEVNSPMELYGLDLTGITLSVPHGMVYFSRNIVACKYSFAQDLNSCYAAESNVESMYPACLTLSSILCQDHVPTNMNNIPDKIGAVIRRGISGHKSALCDAAFRGTRDNLREPYGRIMYGMLMNRGTGYHEKLLDLNVYRNARLPDATAPPADEMLEAVPDV